MTDLSMATLLLAARAPEPCAEYRPLAEGRRLNVAICSDCFHSYVMHQSLLCLATDWAPCGEGVPGNPDRQAAHIYRVCRLPKDHEGRWHHERMSPADLLDGQHDYGPTRYWAESSGDAGPVTFHPCVTTSKFYPYGTYPADIKPGV